MNSHRDDSFDAALRARHQASLDRLSPRASAQLTQRRNAALRSDTVRRGHGFRYAAAGFAALGALAIGLQFGMPTAPTGTAPGSVTASTTAAATMLDEDPEFYAWLASADAQLVAME